MTLQAMQEHEAVTLHYGPTDYRRVGLIEVLRSHVEGNAILDMRCLNGSLLLAISNASRELYGLDGFLPAVESTNKQLASVAATAGKAFLWDLVHIPQILEGKLFDCIICADLLNHVPDDQETLKLIQGLLKPGGKLLLLLPAFPRLEGKRDRSLGHLRRYTKHGIAQLLESYGFSISTIRAWNFLGLLPYIYVEKILRMRLNDPLRYSGARKSSFVLGPVLRWWYRRVESLLLFPVGLSYFVEAVKLSQQDCTS